MHEAHKITPSHLERHAYLYVRQSTLHQVMENTESTKRQYSLKDRALALGWPTERIVVIDSDLGQSAADADRKGFQRLEQEVRAGNVGVVLGLEVSRLARNSADWHRLLELCMLTETLIIDEEGIYDPSHFNDRLLLGLKGTVSEAELHILRSRMWGGLVNKAKRAELRAPLPIGFAYDLDDCVILEPNADVQEAIHRLFEAFRRTGSGSATVREFREKNLLFPMRDHRWSRKPQFIWSPLQHRVVCRILKNPRYAGAFSYCRTRQRKRPGGGVESRAVPQEKWILVKDAHSAYISWEEHEENIRRLAGNTRCNRRRDPIREGPALLQGLVVCGKCGVRMTVRYCIVRGIRVPNYCCGKESQEKSLPLCQWIHGETLDAAVGELVIAAMKSSSLKRTLQAQKAVAAHVQEANNLRLGHVKRSRVHADLAHQRFLHVDPRNRRVADELESDWNAKIETLTQAINEHERARHSDERISEEQHEAVLSLEKTFPELWRNLNLTILERKRIIRLVITDVTLVKTDKLRVNVRFSGGAIRSFELASPKTVDKLNTTDPKIVRMVNRLIDTCTDGEIAKCLKKKGIYNRNGNPYTAGLITRLRHTYKLKDRPTRLTEAGMLTSRRIAELCEVDTRTVYHWRRQGLLLAHRASNRGSYGDYLYEPPSPKFLAKYKGKKIPIPQKRKSPRNWQ